MSFKLLSNLVKTSDNIINNSIVNNIVSIILILYTIFIIPNILNYSNTCSNYILVIYNNIIFKLLVYLSIVYVAQTNIKLSLFMAIAFIISSNVIVKYQFDKYVINIIVNDQLNKKEIVLKKKNKEISNKEISTEISNKEISKEILKEILKQISNKEISNKEISNKEISNKEISNKEISNKEILKETYDEILNETLDNFKSYDNNNNNFSYL